MVDAILYHGQPNGPSLSVLAALEESGLEMECRLIDLLHGDRHSIAGVTQGLARDFAVEGEGPVIVAGGEAMSEAVFLAQYLDEMAGGCGLQPDDPYIHWQMLMWCRQVTERLSPAVAYLGNLAHSQARLAAMSDAEFDTLASMIVSEDLRERWAQLRSGISDEARLEDSKAKIDEFAQRTQDRLDDGRDWLMGEFSIADLETYAWLSGAKELESGAFAGKPQLTQWMERMAQRPSIQKALARETTGKTGQQFAPGPEINRWG